MVLRRAAIALVLITWFAASVSAQPASSEALDKGFQALQSGDAASAASIFREALTRHPGDPQLLFGAGVAAGIQGQDKDAIAFLKQALQIEPQLLQAAVFLGELLYRQGDLELAIKTYERALPGAPPSVAVSMRGRLTAWREEASLPQNRDAIRDDRFTISFDGPVQQKLAARATSVLSAAFWRIGKALGAYPSAPINVILYSERQFHDITGAPEWSAGGFDGQIRLPVRGATQNLAEFDRVLTHELTHAMLKSIASRNLPAWLNEGLAMYFEGRDTAMSERRLAAARLFVPLAVLQTSFARLNSAQAVIAYEESAFATRALVDRIGPAGVGQLLQDLGTGQTMDQAIERFGITFAAFESDLERRVGAKSRGAAVR
ncbi:MAG TPA: tetratricopeptide repeat protein [Vicinamibacterales bacterium]|jgi:tetratricopeptide (TPR) repeat protein|nr:tetratricopeptide repeat protein [Vicinamibacterales bacterium]